uniref:Uncharacterized protein n=1 Tax=viral metagenome TaxID=1070528 RepID=A0A6C0LY95_9ZZZZ
MNHDIGQIKLELITERINNKTETYYNGADRNKFFLNKITGNIPVNNISNKSAYKVLEIINPQPDSVGVLSYSLFGDSASKRFRPGLIEPLLYNSKEMKTELPGWSSRIYIAKNISDDIKNELVEAGYELYVMNVPTKDEGYVWRFMPASENKPFVSHDADMRFSNWMNETSIGTVVKNWLKTDKPFLRRILVSHMHSFFNITPILAGMWGSRPQKNKYNSLTDIKETLEKYDFEGFGMDEVFLTREIWPKMKEHGYYSSSGWKTSLILLFTIFVFSLLIVVIVVNINKKS